ncbi:MAG: glycosyltransferase family 4 protein [Candidatus Thorarchaeota archaeon]|nr:glycosyltransferase family 4 protein [Candidatus Thorarchaeota archaeon]
MKILIISMLFEPVIGGAETTVKNQGQILSERGHDVTILTSRFAGTKNRERSGRILIERPNRLMASRKSGFLFHFTTFLSFFVFLFLVKRRRFDVVHCHMTHYPLLLGFLIKRIEPCAKVVVTSHGSDLNVYGRITIWRAILKWLVRGIDFLFVVSHELEQEAVDIGIPKRKVIYIPNGVSKEFLQVKDDSELEFDVLFFGSVKWQKGIMYLLQASRILEKKKRIIRIAIAGSGPHLPYLQNLSKKLAVSNVEFLGKVSKRRILNLLATSRIVVFPSVTEGFPCALLESLAAGKPIIATPVGEMKSILVNDVNAIVVKPKDPASIVNALLDLLNNDEKQRILSQNARRTISSEYLWESIVDRVLVYYS